MHLQSARKNITVLFCVLFISLAWSWATASGQSTISGSITPSTFSAGATVALTQNVSGTRVTVATTSVAADGSYTFSGIVNGYYRVRPSKAGDSFSPSSKGVHITGTNVSSVNFTASSTATTWSITGTISPSAAGAGATVTLGGAGTASTTADANGNYTFTGLANGSYTVTPARTGYTFTPSSQSVGVNSANVSGVNFTAAAASPATWNISGTISPTTGGAGATVALSGAQSATTTTDANGNFTFTGLANGSYTVTPSETGYTFTPGSLSVSVNSANVSAVNFTATAASPTTWSISGTISPASSGAGSTVALSGAKSASATADANGNYTFSGLANGSYTVTPTKTGYTFSPAYSNVTVNGANITGTNFTASATTSSHSVDLSWTASTTTTVSGYKVYRSSVSGGPYTSLNSNPVTSTLFTDLNVAAGSTYYYVVTAVDSSGNESSYSNQATAVIPTP